MTTSEARPNGATIYKLWRAHCRRKGYSDKITTDQLRLLTRLITCTKAKHPFDISQEDIETWFDELRVSPSTALTYTAQLSSIYSYLADRFEFDNPTAKLERPKRPKRLPRPIPRDLIGEVYERYATSTDLADRRMRAMLALTRLAGFRVSDIAALMGEGVSVASRQLRVIGKGNKERITPLHDEVMRAIYGWRAPKPGLPVISWLDDETRALSARSVSMKISAALPPGWSAHANRHRFATDFYQDCYDLQKLRPILGHESIATTAGYAETDTAASVEVVDRMTM